MRQILLVHIILSLAVSNAIAQADICSSYQDTILSYEETDYEKTISLYHLWSTCCKEQGDIAGFMDVLMNGFYAAYYNGAIDDMQDFMREYDDAIGTLKEIESDPNPYLIKRSNLRSLYYDYLGDYRACIEEEEKIYPVILGSGSLEYQFSNQLGLASNYDKLGRHENAKQYFIETYRIAKEISPPYKDGELMALWKLFTLYNGAFSDPEKTKATLTELKLVAEEIAKPYGDTVFLHHNLHNAYKDIFEYYCRQETRDSAYKYLGIVTRFSGGFHQNLTNIEQQWYQYYMLIGLQDSAKYYLEQNLTDAVTQYGNKHVEVAQAFIETSSFYKQKNDFFASLRYIQNAFTALAANFDDADYHRSPVFEATNSPQDLLRALKEKVFILLQMSETQQGDYLQTAYATASDAILLIDKIRSDYRSDFDKSYLVERSYSVFEMFIAAALKLQEQTGDQKYAEAAFAAAEKSRSIALLDANRLSEVENNFSQEDRNRLYAFRARLTALENKKAALSLDSPEWNGAQQQYSSLHYAFQQFIDQDILTKYPTYYQLKYETAQTGVPEVQKALGTDQSLLLYFVGDSAISAFVVTSNTFTIKVIPLTFPLKTWVEQFRYYMDESHYKEGVDQFVQVASQLYDKLLSPLESLLKPKVIIAADGLLNYLPFEALIAQQPAIPSRFKEHEYFLKLHEVSYCFSATLMIKMARQEKQEQPPPSLMAFAPFYEGDSLRFVYNDYSSRGDTLDALPASGEETYRVSQLWKGKYYWGKSASKQYFMEAAQKTDILLLSTHGKSEDRMGDYSWLAFSKSDTAGYELLYANEIINLRLHSSLVFLSACETGMGKIRRGEGVISLARAFTYAGAKSVITTLWSVNDSGTGSLVIDFFLYLHQGKTQSEALQSAKLRQIQQGRHPYFWAGFVGLGDMEQKYL